jgi:hypothetical protein
MVAKTITGKRVYVLPYSHRFFGALKRISYYKTSEYLSKTAVSWSVIAWFS